jgi:hypothetical protein
MDDLLIGAITLASLPGRALPRSSRCPTMCGLPPARDPQ